MPHDTCPPWVGRLLLCPLRRWRQDPHKLLSPFVQPGMTVLEPGPGMGFFTLELARLVGATGHVIALDVQPEMLEVLGRRAGKAGLADRLALRAPVGTSMAVGDLSNSVDFILTMAVVHELPDSALFFREAAACLKSGGTMLLAEPRGHVKLAAWTKALSLATDAGLQVARQIPVASSHAVLLIKSVR
jgi:ubiquinone/menaquinone biosynthesis C-methylase UbiE